MARIEIVGAPLDRAVRAVLDDQAVPDDVDVIVTDVVPVRGAPERLVLVAVATPASAAAAMDHVIAGRVAGVVCEDALEDLPAAVVAVRCRLVVMASRVLELASQCPRLTERQVAVLGQLLEGGSNATIAAALHLSEATVKREVAAIGATFGGTSRLAVLAAAYDAGFRPRTPERQTGRTLAVPSGT